MMIKALHHHHRSAVVSVRFFGAASAEVTGADDGETDALASLIAACARGRFLFLCRPRFVELIFPYLSHFVVAFKETLVDLGASFPHCRCFQWSNHHKFDSVLLN